MDLAHLNPSQRAAAEHVDGPLLVLAGAGSGKTRVITHRIARLLDLGISPDAIVALSFTNKAAGEMRERLHKMVGKATADELWLHTFHSMGARMMREDPDGFGLDSGRFGILDQGDAFGIIRGLLREHGILGGNSDRRYDLAAIVQRISLWKNDFIAPGELTKGDLPHEYDEVAAAIYGGYEDRLHGLGAVDFDDLVCRVAIGLREPEVAARWQARLQYVLVDEYQDTNTAQLELLRRLVGPRQNLCVVGDDDQAIYGWRGAKVANILGFDMLFPTAKVVKLQENYRSRAPICSAANAVIRRNEGRHDKELVPTRGPGDPVTLVVAEDDVQEAQWVGRKISALIAVEQREPSEIAVLYRSAALGKAIELELQTHGVEYRVLGGQAVYDRKEVKDVLAYLKAIVAPRDELAVRRALEVPSRGVGRASLQRLRAHASERGLSLFEALERHREVADLPAGTRAGIEHFTDVVRRARADSRAGDMAAALRRLLTAIRMQEHIREQVGNDDAAAARWDSVQWLLGSIERWEQRQRARPGAKPSWLEYLGTMNMDGRSATEEGDERPRGKVTLATLHSAKGLEWQDVLLIGCNDGIIPHRRVESPRAHEAISGDLEEERRLFYVGITRARERLWLTRGQARLERGRDVPKDPSRFLAELPQDELKVYEIRREEALTPEAIDALTAAFLAS
jgi:DNA helicase-2/ATP-dependent DNA helicase PcrA